MKFIISSAELLKQLHILNSLVSNNNTLPILDNFLFVLQNSGELTITSSNLEVTLNSTLQVRSEDSGEMEMAVPAKILTEIIKNFTEQPLTFSLNRKKNCLEITSEQGNYSLAIQNSETFPKVFFLEKPNRLMLDAEMLLNMIEQTLFAIGADELRPIMNGVFFQISTEGANFIASDSNKLVKYFRRDIKSKHSINFIIPKKPLQILKNILNKGKVYIEHNEKNTLFILDNKKLTCRLIDGKYPNYEAIIPKENDKILTVNRMSFLSAMKRISLFSNKTTHKIYLEISGNELKIGAEDIEFSNRALERFCCNYSGDDIKICFHSKFLIEILSHINSENVVFEMSSPHRSSIIRPLESTENGEEVLILTMPQIC